MMSMGPRDPENDMNFWYSSEKWKDVLGADEAETICAPPCLDVLKSWKRNDVEEAPHLAPNISGQKGEAAFMQKFQELKIGGIMVSGLKSCELVASQTVPKEIIQKGEWDAIFFHQNRGIFVIEVKATERDGKEAIDDRITKAKTQLDRNIKNIQRSFLMLYQKECTCITGFICFPFRNEDRKIYEGYWIIDKLALNNRNIFRQFFESQRNEKTIELSLLQRFAAEFVCCRSQVEFHSQAYNAMQVATWIQEQDIVQKQDPTKVVSMSGNGPSGKIILTAQQLEIVECSEKNVTIRGAPGSGKTLILMLRALKAAMENKAGSVFVFVNKELRAKYKNYFFEEIDKKIIRNANNNVRKPKVQTIDNIKFVKPEDDVFFDETPVEDSYIEKIEGRVNCSGNTTIVFTGLHKPDEADDSFDLYEPRLKQFKHFKLMKVLRGTGNIFREWEHYYPLGITMGHNIDGVTVKNEIFDSFEQAQNEVANKIATLTSANISNIDLPSLKKEHIAVITCDDNDSTEIRNYLDAKKIPCGEVDEQARRLKSTSIVAVDEYRNTPSYEWPVVFIILMPGVTKKEVLPIAASRCIASLTIITYTNATASSIKADEQQPLEGNTLKDANVQHSLKEMYLTRFQKVYPFSLPFTFDIENTWVSLALKEENKDSQSTEDHAELLKRAFEKVKMLIIEGDPATGKTSLMRRLAYEWAKQKEGKKRKITRLQRFANWVRGISPREKKGIQLYYDLVLYAEFREVREENFESIAELVVCYSKNYLIEHSYENLKKILIDERFCKKSRILVLLDGYDESSLEKQCSEISSYMQEKTIKKQLFFNTVITTRKGHLSNLRGRDGRFLFADVLGFTTKQQKEKYVFNHFLPSEIDSKRNIEAVHHLLNSNQNLNKLAETPLFLTFICLVHERIVDGTLLELYCNITWWLIDRHQQDYPYRDIPCSFGFQNKCNDKFETIQKHYLHFPQLIYLGNMALHNLQENVFKPSDCAQFLLQPIIEQVGLLRKEKIHDISFRLVTSFFFPHRTIQEFLAAFYCFCSNDPASEWLLTNSKLDTSEGKMSEFERFLLRIALSNKMPIHAEKRQDYFEKFTDLDLDSTFDAFNTTAGFNCVLLNWFLLQCTNVQHISLYGVRNSARRARTILNGNPDSSDIINMLNRTSMHNESAVKSTMSSSTLFSFSELMKLRLLEFRNCTFEANLQLSFTNCPSLKDLQFYLCEMKSSTNLGIATLSAIATVKFYKCKIDLAAWQSITDHIRNSSVECVKLSADYFAKKTYPEFLHHLQKCERIQEIHVEDDGTLHRYEEEVTANLAQAAQKLLALTGITISDAFGRRLADSRKVKKSNKELIERAGQERNPKFLLRYVD